MAKKKYEFTEKIGKICLVPKYYSERERGERGREREGGGEEKSYVGCNFLYAKIMGCPLQYTYIPHTTECNGEAGARVSYEIHFVIASFLM